LKATGIVRRIDDLGRVVIPKEIRRTLRIREGDPLEIYVDRDGEVILKKYSPVSELGDFAKEYCDALYEAIGNIILVSDRDEIIAAAGAGKKEFVGKALGDVIERVLENRKPLLFKTAQEIRINKACPIEIGEGEAENFQFTAEVIAPIIVAGDAIGSVIICSRQNNIKMGDMEIKLAETAAGFLAKQMAG
jgi:AbrB family transcriptional regulator (stage V sporulation protein T)